MCLNAELFLMPFQLNKAVFFCHNRDKAEYFMGKLLLNSGVSVLLSKWCPEVNSVKGQRFFFKGGWVAVEGLPFYL